MPKPTKLHSRGKPTSIQKPYKIEKDSSDGTDAEESVRQFQLELCWCIQQLERSLNDKKGTEKQLQEAWKVLTVLKNNNQPMIRKRQLMRTHFGDYRAKMAAEEKKLAKMASKIKISEVPEKPKATFLRKSAFLTTGDESFRFNFNLATEQIDNGNIVPGNTGQANDGNTSQSIAGNTSQSIAGNTSQSDDNVAVEDNSKTISEEAAKKFKFSFSSSDFKFNFNVDK